MDFVALDFETANERLSSICQIGMAVFSDGSLVERYSSFVDPGVPFSDRNVSIHGINEASIKGAPQFPEVYSEILSRLDGAVAVCHSLFDRAALLQTSLRFGLNPPMCTWVDTARVARRAFPQFSQRGYGLANIAAHLGITFSHHDALEDAVASGLILVKAIEITGVSLDEWITSAKPISGSSVGKVVRDANPDGVLFGEVIVFTGTLILRREEAAELAAKAGCTVDASVTKRTTILVV